jgi:hypothetical protein
VTTQNKSAVVEVRRSWNDWRSADYYLNDVEDLHWSNISGGVQAVAPQFFVHGRVWCDGMLNGELAHSCQHGHGPHRIKVCITKTGNEEIWPKVLERAGPRPRRRPRKAPVQG